MSNRIKPGLSRPKLIPRWISQRVVLDQAQDVLRDLVPIVERTIQRNPSVKNDPNHKLWLIRDKMHYVMRNYQRIVRYYEK